MEKPFFYLVLIFYSAQQVSINLSKKKNKYQYIRRGINNYLYNTISFFYPFLIPKNIVLHRDNSRMHDDGMIVSRKKEK